MIETKFIREENLYIYREFKDSGDVLGARFAEYFSREDEIMHVEWYSNTSSRSASSTSPTALYFLEDELNEPEYFQQKPFYFGLSSTDMIKVPILYNGKKHWAWVSKVKLEGLTEEQREKLEKICSPVIKRGFFEEGVLKEDVNSVTELKELSKQDFYKFSALLKDYLKLSNREACDKLFNRTVEQMTYYNCLLIFLRWAGSYYFDEDNFEAFKGLVNNNVRFSWRYQLRYYVNKVYDYAPNSKILKLLKHIANDDIVTDSDIKEFHDVIEKLETLTDGLHCGYSPFFSGGQEDFDIRREISYNLTHSPEEWDTHIYLIDYLDSLTESSPKRGFFDD